MLYGALGARGINSLQNYGEDQPTYDNNANTITSVYSDGQLKMYTSHSTEPTSVAGQPEYWMTFMKGYCMVSDLETFRKGASVYRNARDWGKEQQDNAIKKANEIASNGES